MVFILQPKGRSTFSTEPNQEAALCLEDQSIKPPFHHQRTWGSLTSSNWKKSHAYRKRNSFYAWPEPSGQHTAETKGRRTRSFREADRKSLRFQGIFSQLLIQSLNISANNIKSPTQESHFPAEIRDQGIWTRKKVEEPQEERKHQTGQMTDCLKHLWLRVVFFFLTCFGNLFLS